MENYSADNPVSRVILVEYIGHFMPYGYCNFNSMNTKNTSEERIKSQYRCTIELCK